MKQAGINRCFIMQAIALKCNTRKNKGVTVPVLSRIIKILKGISKNHHLFFLPHLIPLQRRGLWRFLEMLLIEYTYFLSAIRYTTLSGGTVTFMVPFSGAVND